MAYNFNGTTQYLQRSSAPATAVPLTLAAWMNADSGLDAGDTELTGLSVNDSDNVQEFTIELSRQGGVNNAVAVAFSTATGGFAVSSTNPVQGTWHHVTGVFTSNTSRTVYLDGGGSGTDTTNVTPTNISDVTIATVLNATLPIKLLDGKVAEAAIWNVALTAAEAAILAKGYSPMLVRPQSLVFYAPLIGELIDRKGAVLTNVATSTVFVHPRMIYSSKYNIAPFAAVTTTYPGYYGNQGYF